MRSDASDTVLARIEQLEAESRALRDEVRGLRAEQARPAPGANGDAPVTRRRLIGMAGAAAAGAVGATVVAASPAGALDPNDVVLGVTSQAGGAASTGITSSSTSGTIIGDNSGTGAGVEGNASSGAGVVGFTGSGNALVALAPVSTGGVHLRLEPGTGLGPPSSGAHFLGQFWMDSVGVLFQCITNDTPGTWVRQTPLVLLSSPFRVYDSRVGQPNPSLSAQGKLAFGATRTINCSPALPSGFAAASALLMNLTVTGTVGANGALTVFSAGVSAPTASSINWTTAGTNLANAVTSACDGSEDIKVKCVAKAGCQTDFIIDVIGIYP